MATRNFFAVSFLFKMEETGNQNGFFLHFVRSIFVFFQNVENASIATKMNISWMNLFPVWTEGARFQSNRTPRTCNITPQKIHTYRASSIYQHPLFQLYYSIRLYFRWFSRFVCGDISTAFIIYNITQQLPMRCVSNVFLMMLFNFRLFYLFLANYKSAFFTINFEQKLLFSSAQFSKRRTKICYPFYVPNTQWTRG